VKLREFVLQELEIERCVHRSVDRMSHPRGLGRVSRNLAQMFPAIQSSVSKEIRLIGVGPATEITAMWTKFHWRETPESVPVGVRYQCPCLLVSPQRR
jgi:hypothetical protein